IRDFHVTGVQTCALPIFNERSAFLECQGNGLHAGRSVTDAGVTNRVQRLGHALHHGGRTGLLVHVVLEVTLAQRGFLEVTIGAGYRVTTKQLDAAVGQARSEEHTSELQSRENLVCRLLLEKKNKRKIKNDDHTV